MFHLFTKKNGNLKDDSLSGLTVALALVPEAIAFSFIAGVDPLVGLWAAVFMGFITSTLGGRPGMISGATGAIAVVAGSAVKYGNELGDGLGLQFLFAVIIVAGVIQILFGLLKLARFIRLVPHPVMIGFVNGLAIVICMGQFGFFKAGGEWMQGGALWLMIGLVVLTMAIIQFFPKITKAVPSTLVAIIIVGVIAYFLPDARTIENVLKDGGGSGTLSPDFPPFAWPSGFNWLEHWQFILKTAFVVAMVGIIESLMTLQLIDEITETRGQGNRESLAQGAANILSGLFHGMGGCAMIGQSLINIKSGGRGRTSGVVAALALALFIMLGGPVIIQIPIAALVGVMFMVVIGTFEWSTFKSFGKIAKSEMLIIITVTMVTAIMHDLALAVFVGVILSALVFAWESSRHITVTMHKDTPEERIYGVEGMLYFGSVREFSDKFQAKSDVPNIVIDFEEARVCDLSGLEAINALGERYRNAGKTLHIRHLSADCRQMLERAGRLVNIEVLPDDPHYSVARLRSEDSKIIKS
ncbi:MAG: SulP family inorganic anion transporter [Verrucomicrobiae bacterium]|nr:SulP family inorganic anion transporter [Verrucomicrobiae bacterium]NNJ41797.1 SulP family inorganic anion transporter [Akkermansiaceae bacterium]